MRYTLTIDMDNAAFRDEGGDMGSGARGWEVARLLREAAADTETGLDPGVRAPLVDFNGNRVGHWEVTS